MIVLLFVSHQIQSSASVSKILVKTVERVGNMSSAIHVNVCQDTMVHYVKLVSGK